VRSALRCQPVDITRQSHFVPALHSERSSAAHSERLLPFRSPACARVACGLPPARVSLCASRSRCSSAASGALTARDPVHLNLANDEKRVSARPLPEMEFLTRLVGGLFPNTPHPSDTWEGDTNAWDAADWVHVLIDAIAASPTEAATEALERLRADTALSSYQVNILHALANQRQRRRDAEYDRPDWSETIAALDNGPPATVADLHALLD
jgi:hypothetical protein